MSRMLVNCHGGRVGGSPPHPATFAVPPGVTIHFYVQDGGLLTTVEGWNILSRHRSFRRCSAIETRASGELCDDYYGVPYGGPHVASGVFLEREGPHGRRFDCVLSDADDGWGQAEPNTVLPRRVLLPSVDGGPTLRRSAIQLSDLARCPGVTHVDWIGCREVW